MKGSRQGGENFEDPIYWPPEIFQSSASVDVATILSQSEGTALTIGEALSRILVAITAVSLTSALGGAQVVILVLLLVFTSEGEKVEFKLWILMKSAPLGARL